nr:pistil-specific extensin-like protein [Aegilops tauschii subsp. strangulata]
MLLPARAPLPRDGDLFLLAATGWVAAAAFRASFACRLLRPSQVPAARSPPPARPPAPARAQRPSLSAMQPPSRLRLRRVPVGRLPSSRPRPSPPAAGYPCSGRLVAHRLPPCRSRLRRPTSRTPVAPAPARLSPAPLHSARRANSLAAPLAGRVAHLRCRLPGRAPWLARPARPRRVPLQPLAVAGT